MTPQIINFLIVTVVCIFIYSGINRHIESISRKLNEDNKSFIEGKLKALNQLVVFTTYFFYILDFFIDIKMCAAILTLLAIATLIAFKNQITSQITGYFRIINNVIEVNEEVVLNDRYKGLVKNVSLSSVEVIGEDDKVLIFPHLKIDSIQKLSKEYRNVNVSIVLSYREDPEKIEDVLIKLTEKLNEKFKDYLFQNPEGTETATFVYKGITKLNADYQGIKYSISGKVKSSGVKELQRKLNREVAICCHKNNLNYPEVNILSNKSVK